MSAGEAGSNSAAYDGWRNR